jgi:hypothetical protein
MKKQDPPKGKMTKTVSKMPPPPMKMTKTVTKKKY